MISEPTLSVSDAIAFMNQTLEYAYPSMTVVGELANFKISKDKWVYADIKDDFAKMRLFGTIFQLPGPLEDGMMLEITGEPRLHPQFGFSFQIRSMRPIGEGTIKKAANLLQAKLQKEGLFEQERKRLVPFPPQRIALITSLKSAAYADFTKILTARWPYVEVLVLDTPVQGQSAVSELVQAVHAVNDLASNPDALIMIRGGGSADDLAAFSSEQVTRAIAASRVPTVVAIGHEIDESLAELAADMRASTPSNAAELLVPDVMEVKKMLTYQESTLDSRAIREISRHKELVAAINTTLSGQAEEYITAEKNYLERTMLRLDSYHPHQVLKRGYALVRSNGVLLKKDAVVGQILEIELEKSTLETTVNKVMRKG